MVRSLERMDFRFNPHTKEKYMGFQVTPNKTLATTAVSIKLPDAAAVKVENLATKNGLTRGNIVAQMVDYALSNLNTVKKKKK